MQCTGAGGIDALARPGRERAGRVESARRRGWRGTQLPALGFGSCSPTCACGPHSDLPPPMNGSDLVRGIARSVHSHPNPQIARAARRAGDQRPLAALRDGARAKHRALSRTRRTRREAAHVRRRHNHEEASAAAEACRESAHVVWGATRPARTERHESGRLSRGSWKAPALRVPSHLAYPGLHGPGTLQFHSVGAILRAVGAAGAQRTRNECYGGPAGARAVLGAPWAPHVGRSRRRKRAGLSAVSGTLGPFTRAMLKKRT